MPIVQISSYYPPHLGGMQFVVQNVSKELSRRKIYTIVYTSSIGSRPHTENDNLYLTVNYLFGFEIANTPIIPTLFWNLLLLPKDTIIHLHIAQAFLPEIVYLASKLRGYSYISQIHLDVLPSGFFGFLLKPYKKIFLGTVLRNSQLVVCLNEDDRKMVVNSYKVDPKNIQILPNGVDSVYFTSRTIFKKARKLLFVGRLSKQKNIELLIKSVNILGKDYELNIVGEGEEREMLQRLINSYSLSNNIKIHGAKNKYELVEFYKDADILLLSSHSESSPLVILESFAAGLPIIAPNLPTLKSLWKDSLEFSDTSSPENYARIISTLSNNFSRRKYLSDNGQKIAKNYKWNSVTNQLIDIYNSI